MKSNLSAATFLVILAVCFALGIISALVGRGSDRQAPGATASALSATSSSQTTVLIVGVDDLQSPRPVLQAVWLATYRLPGHDIFLLGLPTDLTAETDSGRTLADAFTFSLVDGLQPEVFEIINRHTPLDPDLVVVLDRTAFSAIVDYVGGLDLNNAHLEGVEVMAVLDMLTGDPQAALATQARILLAMSLRAPLVGDAPDITPLLDLLPSHAYLSAPVTQAVALASPILPIDPDEVHFDLLEPEATPEAPGG